MKDHKMNVHASMKVIRRALGGSGFCKRQWQPLHREHALAAADALEDAEKAIDAFANDAKGGGDFGVAYLKLYGVLQAAVLQQDAVNVLRVAFGFVRTLQKDLPKGMQAIRDIRNRVGGHPADPWGQPGKAPPPATMVARHSVCGGTLAITYLDADFAIRHETVDLDAALGAHRQAVREWLLEVAEKVRSEEQAFRNGASAAGQLSALVHPSWEYLLGNLREAASLSTDEARRLLVHPACGSLRTIVNNTIGELKKRSLFDANIFDQTIILGALERFEDIVRRGPSDAADQLWLLDVLAYYKLIESRFSEFVEALADLDRCLQEPA
jgi:hypothetical protein